MKPECTCKCYAELKLRRAQMAAHPFCSDHRDKVRGKQCRECEIEHLKLIILAAKHLILAAKGPIDGPTSWEETKERWMFRVEEIE